MKKERQKENGASSGWCMMMQNARPPQKIQPLKTHSGITIFRRATSVNQSMPDYYS